jgi:hypothetical protein
MGNYEIHMKEGYPFDVEKRVKRIVNYINSSTKTVKWGGKGVFDKHIQAPIEGFSYMDGTKSTVSLVQISGVGCEKLRQESQLDRLVHDWHDRLTRLDVAVDIETTVHPEPFARSRTNNRFKSDAHIHSIHGETWYVGGKESDRHARVYRYADGHPRHGLLRVEYELHDGEAKRCAKDIIERGILSVAIDLGATFGWSHSDYMPPTKGEKLPALSRPNNFGKTEFWIHRAVKPALSKLARSGKLSFLRDFESWLHAMIIENEIDQLGDD